ncbi:unnamed protein product, partial [Tenebrio molitor]
GRRRKSNSIIGHHRFRCHPQSHAKKEKKAKNPRAKPSHPPTSEMVNNAIKGLKERGGSSLQAIKKFVAANYKVDAEKVAPFIKKYLKGAVASGSLVQTKGKGASGSFSSPRPPPVVPKSPPPPTRGNPLRPPHPRRKNHPPNVPPSRRLPTRLPRRQPKTSLPKAKKTAAEKKSAAAASA